MKNTKYSHEEAFDPEVKYTISEEWKPIKGYEGLYAVSSKGKVMNLMSGKVLKNGSNTHGYSVVNLCKGDGKPKNMLVHRLVAEAFIPNPLNLPQVDHVDENKGNNDVSNLRWVTASQNRVHSNHQHSCKINQYTLDGEFIRTWESSKQIERELGYSQGNIIKCCKRYKNYSHVGGFKWEYADPEQQHKHNRPVAVLTKDGEFVSEYKSAADASMCLKIKYICIYLCLNGTIKSTHGLKFIYID